MTNQSHHIPDYLFTENVRFVQKAIVQHPSENKFLIIKRSATEFIRPNTWDIPGGSVHYGELHKDALIREVKEESGLSIKSIKDINVVTSYDSTKPVYCIIVGSVCTATSNNVTLSSEHGEYKWVTVQEFLDKIPNYTFVENRPFNIHSTDFLGDIVYLHFMKNKNS